MLPHPARMCKHMRLELMQRFPSGHYIYEFMALPGHEGQIHRDSFERAFKPSKIWWQPNQDTWLRYFSEEDLAEWTSYLLPRLEFLISQARLPIGNA